MNKISMTYPCLGAQKIVRKENLNRKDNVENNFLLLDLCRKRNQRKNKLKTEYWGPCTENKWKIGKLGVREVIYKYIYII